MAQVIWSRAALRNLTSIRVYIGYDNPKAAQEMALRLVKAGESLCDHPLRGRAIHQGRRELATMPPYLIRYRVEGDEVEIESIRHGARRPN